MPVPTVRLALLAALLVAAQAVLDWDLLVGLLVVNGALLLVTAFDFFAAPGPNAVEIRREFPSVIVLGHRAELGWTLVNRTNRSIRVAFADELAPSLRAIDRRFSLRLTSRARAHVATPVKPARRGRFRVAELVVRLPGPLGLIRRQYKTHEPIVISVHPAFPSRPDAELRLQKARVLEVGLRSAKGRGGGTDIDQLREYTVDDEFRRLDWAATARAGKPIVRTFRAERNQTVIALLDNGRTMAARVADVPRVEHAMDALMCLVTVATGLGDRVGLIAYDREVRAVVPASAQHGQLGRITGEIFDLEPALIESDYRAAFLAALTRFKKRTLFVLLGELNAATIEESLIPALPLIARRHEVIFGSVQDPQVEAWANEVPADAEAAYRKVSAVASQAKRRRLTAVLQGYGVRVVDVPPGTLAPQLTDAYLHIKATGQL
jgi:uncharacterized protein (DUF58 family)